MPLCLISLRSYAYAHIHLLYICDIELLGKYPASTCAPRGIAIGCVRLSVCLSVEKLPDLEIKAPERSFDKAHERRKHFAFVGHAYQLHPHMLSAHVHNLACNR
jgi:hypothetical protein